MEGSEKRPRGRPRMPETDVINLRIGKALLERLDRYVDSEALWNRTDINRATVMREAFDTLLAGKGF